MRMTVPARTLVGLDEAEKNYDLRTKVDWGCKYAVPGEYSIPDRR